MRRRLPGDRRVFSERKQPLVAPLPPLGAGPQPVRRHDRHALLPTSVVHLDGAEAGGHQVGRADVNPGRKFNVIFLAGK